MSKRLGLFDDIIILSYYNWYYCTVLHCTMSRMNGKKTHTHTHYVKNGKRCACEQKAATVLPNRTAAA